MERTCNNEADGASGDQLLNEHTSGGGMTLGKRGDGGRDDADTKLDVDRDPTSLPSFV